MDITRIAFERTGDPSVLRAEKLILRPPGPGEILIQHQAIGVNFIDTYHRTGLYPVALPSGIGLEAAGTISAIGPGVRGLKLGQRVAYCTGPIGAYATAHLVAADRVVPLPDAISSEVAAAVMLKGLTAQYLIRQIYKVKSGDTVLVHAIAGGVGLIVLQWLKHLGATVIGTVGSEEKARLARTYGCDHVILYRQEDVVKRVDEITNGRKLKVVYDSVGKDTFQTSLNCLAPRGLFVSYGNASGPVAALDPGMLAAKGSLFFTRPRLFDYVSTAPALRAAAKDLFTVIISGAVKADINQRFPLTEAAAAHRALESRGTTGATILLP